ncbi:MAG: NAD-dependent epimerase/dehydratase [Ramlibacter sp.]|jgi:uronate dehydrogenase|nr:NAD-dependent epimerase/dehydratase [Ramlibacter sp.]
MTSTLNRQLTNRLLLTGAAGALGTVLRQRLKPHASILRLSDIAPLAAAQDGEEVVPCDLADKAAVDRLVEDCSAIVHMGGISVERPFEEILEANIRGAFHIYEGARRHGVRRVVFASSNHVVGFHEQSAVLDADAARRPDGYYGLSKSFGEDLSRFYFDRYGIETACLRIGSAYPQPKDRRMLSTWLSYDDLVELVRCALFAPQLGHTIVYGVSANPKVWWDNGKASHLGFQPKDSSAPYNDSIPAPASAPDERAARFQGGTFVTNGPFETL